MLQKILARLNDLEARKAEGTLSLNGDTDLMVYRQLMALMEEKQQLDKKYRQLQNDHAAAVRHLTGSKY